MMCLTIAYGSFLLLRDISKIDGMVLRGYVRGWRSPVYEEDSVKFLQTRYFTHTYLPTGIVQKLINVT